MRTESPDCSTAFLRFFLAFLQRAFLCFFRALALALRFEDLRRAARQRRAGFLRFFFAAVALDFFFLALAFLHRARALAERPLPFFALAFLQRFLAAAFFLRCTATVLPGRTRSISF